jgi:hypothetical protein
MIVRKKARTGWPLMNADERRLKTTHLRSEIRVHLRSSAANRRYSLRENK